MIQVRELQVFIMAAETENFSAAARNLRLSQPAISFQIQSLEKKLEVQLFERKGKRVALTDIGRELLPMARELSNLSMSIEGTIAAQHGTLIGHLEIGCGTSLAK
ncbi:partial HTH-type transcriptional regulator TdfR, partial [Anaerolineae bacterium]